MTTFLVNEEDPGVVVRLANFLLCVEDVFDKWVRTSLEEGSDPVI